MSCKFHTFWTYRSLSWQAGESFCYEVCCLRGTKIFLNMRVFQQKLSALNAAPQKQRDHLFVPEQKATQMEGRSKNTVQGSGRKNKHINVRMSQSVRQDRENKRCMQYTVKGSRNMNMKNHLQTKRKMKKKRKKREKEAHKKGEQDKTVVLTDQYL